MKRIPWKTGLRLLVAVGLLGLIVWQSDGTEVYWELLSQMSLSGILVVLVVATLDRLLMAYKWLRLLRVRGCKLPLLKSMQIYCFSMLWGMALPATIGADAVRIVCTRRERIGSSEVVASILIERVIGFLAIPLLVIVSLLLLHWTGNLDPRLGTAWWAGMGLLVVSMVALWLSLSERVFNFLYERVLGRLSATRPVQILKRFHSTYRSYRAARRELTIFFLLTVLEGLVTIVFFWLIAVGMRVEVGLLSMAAAVPLAYLISRLPLSVGGLGVFEGVFALVLTTAAVPVPASLSIALFGRILQIVAWVPWCLTYVSRVGGGLTRLRDELAETQAMPSAAPAAEGPDTRRA